MGIVARQSAHAVATNLFNKFVIGLLIDVLISRVLGTSGKGEYALFVTTITGLTALFSFGIPFANAVVGARGDVSHPKLIQLSLYAALIATAVSVAMFLIGRGSGWLTFVLPKTLSDDYLFLAAQTLPFVFLNGFLLGLLIGKGEIIFHNYVLLGSQACGLMVISVAALAGWLTSAVAIASYLLTFICALIAIVWKCQNDFRQTFNEALRLSDIKRVAQISTFVYLGAIMQFLNYRLDTYFVEFYLGSSELGIYVTAVRIAETLWILSASMSNAIVATAAAGNPKAREASFKLALLSLLIGAAAAAGLFIAGKVIIIALFSEKFALAAEPLFLLLPGAVILGVANVLGPYLASIGRPDVNLYNAFLAMLATIALDIWLIPKLGVNGAAIASSIAYALFAALTLIAFSVITKLDLRQTGTLAIELKNDVRASIEKTRQRFGI
ncbi:MAG: polysaccharide biosynthesis C-terminal domain-containing protein [Chloroherpetonaceae bacterium]|nr:polysaccharide biosynthesis C-terminal domain-containing protein [Chloroherpetonaceae bacterium]MCS7210887.1 polysaccharide biosynthesis C-terminal domain-containing protein [Chloroherpetonaceae bacterium]MDW8019178.1 polysaccharide biosynthesis C-terminal domain-containing protein [Chloroherpetonaceae bacterium]MDW8465648.1 polysaccharide biosynthesis C-terminal domain-containing protein [Chloroherpetonaceae bacterium]